MIKNKAILLTALTVVVAGSLVGCGNETKIEDNPNQSNQEVAIDKENTEDKDDKTQVENTDENKEENKEENVETKEVVYYIPNDNVDGLNKVMLRGNIKDDIESPQFFIDKFIEEGLIAKGTKVNSFNEISKGIYKLDLSKEFYDLQFGTSAEELLLNSIGNTYIEKFGVDKIKLTVDGQNYSSGHMLMEDNDYLTFTKLTANSQDKVVNID